MKRKEKGCNLSSREVLLGMMVGLVFMVAAVEGQSPHQRMVYRQQLADQLNSGLAGEGPLDATKLSIFAVRPGVVRWPVILAGVYDDPSFSQAQLIFDWRFDGIDDQSCTQGGRSFMDPCRGQTIEKTFMNASPQGGYNVTLTLTAPGRTPITASVSVQVTNNFNGPVVTRRDCRTLSTAEWNRLIWGFMDLKKKGVWDHLTFIHQVSAFTGTRPSTQRNAAHRGPALLPWHRVFVRHMERAMQTLLNDTTWGLPYWDWAAEQASGNPFRSQLWTDQFFGPTGDATQNYAVPSGYFCGVASGRCAGNWTIPWALGGPVLERELGRVARTLPSPIQVLNVLSVQNYDTNPYDNTAPPPGSFRSALEGAGGTFYGLFHNGVHSWIGGAMGTMASPNDPIFWLHHSNVDRLFWLWQVRQGCQTGCYRPLDNDQSVTQATPGSQLVGGQWRIRGHHWGDMMYPWALRPRDVYPIPNNLDGYQYDRNTP